MSLVESTVSPLGAASKPLVTEAFDPIDGEQQEEAVEEREPIERPEAKTLLENLIAQIDDINIARYLPDDELDQIGMMCVDEYRIDETSRNDWCDKAEKAMQFAVQDTKPKQYPFPGASNMIWPVITQSALEFAARTMPAIVQGRNVVKGVVWGSDKGTPATKDGKPDGEPIMQTLPNGQEAPIWLIAPGEKRIRADRIGEHMSWQLLKEMPEWRPQTDQMLHQMPVIGGATRKTFRDHVEGRNKSLFVSLLNLVWNYHAPSFEAAPRHTEKVLLYPNQIIELQRTGLDDGMPDGMFLPLNYGPGGGDQGEKFDGKPLWDGDQSDPDAPQLFIEQHRALDLDDDGYAEPYIVTVHLRSGKVVRIVARYDEEGIEASDDGDMIYKIKGIEHYTLYRFLPNIDGGSYPMGFGHILRPLNEAINTTTNQMFDAGHLQNAGGGFMSDQIGVPSGQTLFQVGKYARVTTKGADIRSAVFPIPFPGPSPVLFQLLGTIIAAAKELGSIGNILAGDAAIANAPPTTVLALIEQGMKFYTAVVERVFCAEESELEKLFRLNRRYITETQSYQFGEESREITVEDYTKGGGVAPVADPTMTTDMQKLGRAQVLMSTKDEPGVDRMAILRRFYEAANIDRIDELFAQPDPQAAALAQAATQMEMALKQAELGKIRADELKSQTQAFLNMALARKNANSQEEAFINAQLDFLRLHIEALNTSVKAATVDHRFHDTNMRHASATADRAAAAAAAAGLPVPGPSGAFPTPPDAPIAPDVVTPTSPGTGSPAVPGPTAAPELAPTF